MQRLFDTDCFLKPHGDSAVRLCRLVDGKVEEGGPVSLPFDGSTAVSGQGWVVALVRDGRRVWVGRFDAETLTVEHQRTIALPPKSQVVAPGLVLVDDVAILGGVAQGSTLFGTVDLTAESPTLSSLSEGLPPRLLEHAKPIDALVTDGRTLYVVDNIAFPKYLLTYDLTGPGGPAAPRFGQLVELPLHGTYEHYHHAALGQSHLALVSSSCGRAGQFHHVSLLDRQTLEELATHLLTLEAWEEWGEEPLPIYRPLTGVLLLPDRLVLVNNQDEVAYAPLPELPAPLRFAPLAELDGAPLAELVVLPGTDTLVAIGADGACHALKP